MGEGIGDTRSHGTRDRIPGAAVNEVPVVPSQGIVGKGVLHCAAIAGADTRGVSVKPAGRGLASVNAGPSALRSRVGSLQQVSMDRGPAAGNAFMIRPGVWTRYREPQENTM